METKEKSELLRNVAKILREIMKKHRYSQECKDCGTENPFFDDSCEFVGLHAALMEFVMYLENHARYIECLKK